MYENQVSDNDYSWVHFLASKLVVGASNRFDFSLGSFLGVGNAELSALKKL